MTQDLHFPGGLVRIDPERVWSALQRWLDADGSRRCSVYHDSLGYCCRLTWDTNSKEDSGGKAARSDMGIADAVANTLMAVNHAN